MVLWLIGLSGSGKTTLAKEIVSKLQDSEKVVLIDGDVVREIFSNDLGYSLEDRRKNAQRICQLGKFLDKQGLIVVVAILSLFEESRAWNKKNLQNYFEVFIDTPIEDLIKRDSKKIYSRFKKGEIQNVAGMDINFKKPECPNLTILNDSSKEEFLKNADSIIREIIKENV